MLSYVPKLNYVPGGFARVLRCTRTCKFKNIVYRASASTREKPCFWRGREAELPSISVTTAIFYSEVAALRIPGDSAIYVVLLLLVVFMLFLLQKLSLNKLQAAYFS